MVTAAARVLRPTLVEALFSHLREYAKSVERLRNVL